MGQNAIRLYELDQQHDEATFAGSINRGTTRIHSLDFSHQGQYIYWTEMGIVQMVAQLGQPPLQLSYPRLKRAAVADLGTVESFPDPVQGGDVRRAEDGSMILVGKAQNLIYSIDDPDAATPTVLGPVPLNSGGYTFVLHPNMALQPLVITKDSPVKQRAIGQKHYELSDHLGNVRVVLSDVKMATWNSTTTAIEDYRPELLSRADYYAFGSLLPGRNYNSGSYRMGFNGQEKVDEVNGSTSTHNTALFWEFDTRTGRRWNLDPIFDAWESGYATFANNPIYHTDVHGDTEDERKKAIEKAKEYKDQNPGKSYRLGAKGQPGEKVDCSGLVSGCVVAAGLADPNNGNADKGTTNIKNNTTSVALDEIKPGNGIWIDFNGGDGTGHTGIVTSVTRDADGNVSAYSFIHSGSSNGPTENTVKIGKKSFYSDKVSGFYAWDTPDDAALSTTTAAQVSKTIEMDPNKSYFIPGPEPSIFNKLGYWLMDNMDVGTGGHSIGRWLADDYFQ